MDAIRSDYEHALQFNLDRLRVAGGRTVTPVRLVSYAVDGTLRPGLELGGEVIDVERAAAAAGWDEATRAGLRSGRAVVALGAGRLRELADAAGANRDRLAAEPLDAVRLGPPVPDPQKIICLGLNYRDHAAEAGLQPPAAPMFFAKFPNSLIGPARRHRAAARDRPGRLRGRAGRRHRHARPQHRGRRRARPRRRRDGLQRRQRARPADGQHAVDGRQGDRHVRPLRAGAGPARGDRRPAGARGPHARERRDGPGRQHRVDDLRRRRDDRVPVARS